MLQDLLLLKDLTTNPDKLSYNDYKEYRFDLRLDFADAYMEVLVEINQLLDWSKDNLPRLIADLMLAV